MLETYCAAKGWRSEVTPVARPSANLAAVARTPTPAAANRTMRARHQHLRRAAPPHQRLQRATLFVLKVHGGGSEEGHVHGPLNSDNNSGRYLTS